MKHTLKTLAVLPAIFSSAAANAELAERPLPQIGWTTTINHFQIDADKFVGQRLTVVCPKRTRHDASDAVFGTAVYTSDSPICSAAVHAGALNPEGGSVTLQVMPGADSYAGEVRNGIASQSRPKTERAIAFVADLSLDLEDTRNAYIPRIDWDTKFTRTGLANRDLIGQEFSFKCPAAPAGMRERRVVGTDRYAFDSMICRAAVHAGHISFDGGPVTLRLEAGTKDLFGSERNGIETQNGSSVVRTVTFVDG